MRGVLGVLVVFSSCATVRAADERFDVAVTVDDLPAHGPLVGESRLQLAKRFLEVLAAHGLTGVHGFVNGEKVDADTEPVLTAWRAAGHHLSNHTWSHPSLNALSAEAFLDDVVMNEAVLTRFEPDSKARHFFRYPYLFEGDKLEKREAVRDGLFARGYRLAHVSIDGDDWAFNPPFARCTERNDQPALAALRREFVEVHVEELERMRTLTRTLAGHEVPQVLLLHLGAGDVAFLDALLTAFERRGARWVSLEQALGDSFYEVDPKFVKMGGAAFPYRVAKARSVKVAAPPIYMRTLEDRLDAVCLPPEAP